MLGYLAFSRVGRGHKRNEIITLSTYSLNSAQSSNSTLASLYILSFFFARIRESFESWIMNPDPQLLDPIDKGSWIREILKGYISQILLEGQKGSFFSHILPTPVGK